MAEVVAEFVHLQMKQSSIQSLYRPYFYAFEFEFAHKIISALPFVICYNAQVADDVQIPK